ncbi:sulfite exporter TauE/SafE family protein 1 [Musa acuminata AAA Group]|uniref:sulfite exporter TauE/SafE family protein 1 n=1 Tax=Musa acuminata AAA Group TaxID=214697 RepID=UPI0031CDC5D1
MNDSLFLLQCVLLLLPLTVLTTTRLSVAGATESTSQLHGIELLLNLRDRWKESIQREASLGYHTIISCVLCFIAASVSSAGGVSGGSLFLPILNLVAGLDLKVATTYSAFMVTGGSLANVLYNVILTNHGPEAAKKPLINYDIALLSQPSMLAGVSLGVICNIMFPEWLIVVLFAVFLACSTYRTCKAGLRCWNSETQEMERSDGCGWEGNGGAEGANGGVEEALLGGAPEGRMMRFPWEDTVVLAMVWALFFLLHLLIGGKHGKGAMNLKPCGVAYWSITFSQVPLSIAFTLYVLYEKKKKKKKKNCRQQEEGEDKVGTGMAALPMFVFPSAALSAGALSGLFGIGGGLLLNPVLLQIGIAPQTAAATSTFMVMFSASMTALQYVILGMTGIGRASVYAALCFVASATGLVVMKRIIVKSGGRVSLTVFTVTAVMSLSTITVVCYGTADVWNEYTSGKYMGFRPPC